MPITHGHGNPVWTREETILALDLYLRLNRATPDQSHHDVKALSEFLRAMPVHEIAARQSSFRNPAGVALKIQNLHSIAKNRGLKTSRTDRLVWMEFGNDNEKVSKLADLIRSASDRLKKDQKSVDQSEDDEEELPEGKSATRLHTRKERNRKLRRKVLLHRRSKGPLKCEICDTGAILVDVHHDDAIFEVHHNISPLAAGERTTRIADVSLLCANCHKHLHRIIKIKGAWMLVSEAVDNFRKVHLSEVP